MVIVSFLRRSDSSAIFPVAVLKQIWQGFGCSCRKKSLFPSAVSEWLFFSRRSYGLGKDLRAIRGLSFWQANLCFGTFGKWVSSVVRWPRVGRVSIDLAPYYGMGTFWTDSVVWAVKAKCCEKLWVGVFNCLRRTLHVFRIGCVCRSELLGLFGRWEVEKWLLTASWAGLLGFLCLSAVFSLCCLPVLLSSCHRGMTFIKEFDCRQT